MFRGSRFQMAGLCEMILFLENVVPGCNLTLYCRPIYFHLECPTPPQVAGLRFELQGVGPKVGGLDVECPNLHLRWLEEKDLAPLKILDIL